MSTKHSITRADQIFVGGGYDGGVFGRNGRAGVPVDFITKIDLGAPKVAVAAGIVNAATTTELPNADTKTYTAATNGTSPLDPSSALTTTTVNGQTVMALDVPRNITAAVTHASAVLAMTLTITGYDEYQVKMVETLSITAGGTAKAATGLKAFAYIESIAITAAGNATTNTLNLGFGDVLGFPYKIASKSDVLSVWFDDAVDAATIVPAVTTDPATAVTGDVRGTLDPNGVLNGAKTLMAYIRVADPNTAVGLRGVAQYAA
jgi:hypothetical protein